MRNTNLSLTLISLLFCFLFSAMAHAGSVTKVSGTKALIQLDGDAAKAGDEFYVLNSSGKKVAIIKITTVKGDRAVGDVLKGAAVVGGSVRLKLANGDSSQSNERPKTAKRTTREEHSVSKSSGRKQIAIGAIAGYGMNSMTLTVQNSTGSAKEDVTLKDSSFSAKAFADYDMSPDFTIRAATGLESFNVTGSTATAICDNGASKTCTVAFNYLALEGSAHYNFLKGNTRAWVGLGYSFLLQMSKNVTVPNLSADGGTNQMILFSGGADIGMGGGSFVPVVLEYGMFPGSSNVVASAIYARVGYGWNY